MKAQTCLLLIAFALAACAATSAHRSKTVRDEFQRLHPCPSTLASIKGGRRGACPGYIADHIIPLACGGADSVDNLQWQTVADAKAKDKIERQCLK